MKKIFAFLALVSFALTVGACNQSQSSTGTIESSDPPYEGTDSNCLPESSEDNSSSSPQIIDNQLYTESGLKVYFKAEGAQISKIEFGGKQIAKDGFTVGRCANRIANGKFTLNGTEYNVSKNSGSHSLHGGAGSGMNSWRGPFATKNWTKVEQTFSSITYTIHSNDGENGYPGNMDMTVKYTLNEQGELAIQYTATTDKDTLCNPTNHLFMSLNANTNYQNISLQINADNYTPLANQIPTGEIAPVAGTQFDYRTEKAFDSSKNYDDNYVLNGTGYRKVASMTGNTLDIRVDVYTDRAGLQLYKDGSGNICLETQQFPDMINHPEFASYGTTVLKAGETFNSKTTYHFHKGER